MRINGKEMACAMIRNDLKVKDLERLTGLSRSTIQSVKSGKSCQDRTGMALVEILGKQIIERSEINDHHNRVPLDPAGQLASAGWSASPDLLPKG